MSLSLQLKTVLIIGPSIGLIIGLGAGLLASPAYSQSSNLKAMQQLKQSGVPALDTKKVAKNRVRVTSPKLKEAIIAYRDEKLDTTLRLLDQLLQDASLNSNDRGIALFFMGKLLFRMQFYYASVPYFQTILEQYPEAVFYPYAFQRLIWVVKRDGMNSLLVDPLRARKSSLVPRNYRDDVYYIFARTYFEEKDEAKAISAVKSIQPSSEYYSEGQLMMALIYLRRGQKKEALAAFNEAAKSTDEDVKGLAQLGIARMQYGQGENRLSIQNYSQVDFTSKHWLTSQLEASWAHFRNDEPSLALGDVHPFDSDAFLDVFSPEASIIKSTVFFRLCRYNDAEKAIITFFERYAPIYRQIETFNAKYRNDDKTYRREVLKAVFRETTQLPAALTKEIFSQTWFDRRVDQLQSLKKELDLLNSRKDLSGTQSVKLARSYVRDQMSAQADQLLKAAIPLLKDWEVILADFFRRAATLRFEAAFATIDLEKRKAKKDVEIPKDQQYEVWKFDQEYWQDEMSDYRYLLRSECAEDTI